MPVTPASLAKLPEPTLLGDCPAMRLLDSIVHVGVNEPPLFWLAVVTTIGGTTKLVAAVPFTVMAP